MSLEFPQFPTLNETYTLGDRSWVWNGYAWDKLTDADTRVYIIAFYGPGRPEAGETLIRHTPPMPVSFPAALAGSIGRAKVPATADSDFLVKKAETTVGTMRFAAGATDATFLPGDAFSLNLEDITVVAPAVPDATLADISFTLSGSRE